MDTFTVVVEDAVLDFQIAAFQHDTRRQARKARAAADAHLFSVVYLRMDTRRISPLRGGEITLVDPHCAGVFRDLQTDARFGQSDGDDAEIERAAL